MVTRIKYALCVIWLVCGISLSWAQEPITVTVSPVQRVLPPQIGLYLDNPGKYFTLTLRNNTDVTQNVFMGMQIEQIAPFNNMAVITPPNRMPQKPITIAPGEVKMLNLVEMKTLFNHLNYTTDVSVRGNIDEGLLEEGTYEARLTAYKWDATLTTPYPLSIPTGGRCQFEVCYKVQAPRFLSPFVDNTKTINRRDRNNVFLDFGNDISSFSTASLSIENPIFTWTPPTTNCSSMGSYNYSFKIAILLPGQSPTEAMSNGAFYENSQLKVPQCVIPANYVRRMKENTVYVAQVTASIGSSSFARFPRGVNSRALDYMLFENEGKSEIRLFKITKGKLSISQKSNEIRPVSNLGNGPEGDGSGNATGFNAAEKDSLYVFTNPMITSPQFPEITYRKVFTGEDIHVEWRKAWFAKGEGERQDTIKHKYTLQLFQGEINENRSQTFKKNPIFTSETENLKDTIKWDDMEDKMEVGNFYVLRVLAKSLNEKSVRYENDEVNTTDFYLANRFTKTREFACPEASAPTNMTPTSSTPEQLKGKTVGLGQYTLTLGNDLKKGSGDGSFSGTGHVEWNPLGMSLMVAVKFENIHINTDNIVYEGVVKSDPGKSNTPTDIESVEQLFSDWGVDNFIADLNVPYAEQTQGLANAEVGNLAKNLHLSKYYKYYVDGKKALSIMNGESVDDLHLPISIDDVYNNTPVDIQIANMTFTPTRAMMNVIGEFIMPDADITDEEFLIFGAPMLCMSPDRLLPESGNMCLLSHFTVKDPKTKFKCKFLSPDDITNPTDGCYVAWKNDTFEFMQVHVEMAIPDLKKDVGGEAIDAEPVLTLKASIHDWDNWMAMAAMDPFQIEDLPGYSFSPGYILYDHHSEENNELMPMPKDYQLGLCGITKNEEWQGLYMRNMYVSIPTIIEGSGKVDDSAKEQVDDIVQQGNEITVVKEDKKKVDIADSRVKFLLKNFYLDKSGVTCKAELDTRAYLKAATNKVGGWAISLDEIYVDVLQNYFKRCGFNGKFNVPLLKNKKGNKAEIHYMAGLESYNKRENPKDEDRLFIFKTWQTEQISMDFFLADVEFDEKQTFFLVEAEDTKKARVELCLGGDISISSRIANNLGVTTKLGFSLPEIQFTRMRLANCQRWKSEVDKNQAQQYQNWVDEWTAEGREDDRTMVSDDKTVYFDIGKWSGASPQKKLGGFGFTIEKFKLNTSNLAGQEIGLTIGGKLGVLEDKLQASATFSIMATADMKNKSLRYKDTNFEDATIDSDFGGIQLKGTLEVPNSTTEQGYKGELHFKMPGDFLEFDAAGAYVEKRKTQTEINDELKKKYGNNVPAKVIVDSTYNYCFLEIQASSKALSILQPVSIKSIKGGFYWNCRKKDVKLDFSKDNVTAHYGMLGGLLGVGLTCGGDNAITANGDMMVFYDMFHHRLSTIKMKADMHAVTNDDGSKGLVNAEASIVYECTDEKKYFEVDVTVDASADMEDAFKEFVGSDLVANLKKKANTGLSEMGEGSGRNTETSQADKNEQQKKGESSGHLKAGATVNVNFKITWKDKKVEYKTALWHLYIGQPSKNEEQDKRCRITFIDFALGKKTDHFAMWATIYADAYLCFGNELPLDDLPPIPKEISDYLGLKQENLTQGDGDLNAEAVSTRTKQFSTFKPGGDKGGVAFGAKIYGDMGLNLGLVYARSTAIAGFDVMIMKLKKGTQCIGGGEAGKHGWYGMGQVYALLKGEIGLDIDLWLYRGKIPLVDVGLGALLKAGMPNPTWIYGKAKAHFNLLGGLIKGSATVQLKAGEVCTPEFGNPLDNIDIFGDVTPGDEDHDTGWNEDNIISASVYPEFNTNMEMDTPFRLLDQNKAYQMADFDEELEKYSEQASRTYRFCLSPDSIRLACFEPDQATADKPNATFDQRVPYNTKNHKIYNVASGSLDYGKLYRLKLSGYAQEWRDGEWGDPFFNDSTTNHKDKRVPWYQTQYYYFRTDPTPAVLEKDIMVFNTDYYDDLKRPTFALAHSRWDIDNFGSADEPVSLRIEVTKPGSNVWESPSKILHNEQASYDYRMEQEAYDRAVEEAYAAAMKEYEEGPLAEYNKRKNAANKQWKNDVYTPWLDAHYPGWRDWNFLIREKVYRQAIDPMPLPTQEYIPEINVHEFEENIKEHIVDLAREKGEVVKMKEALGRYKPNNTKESYKVLIGSDVNTTTIIGNKESTSKQTNIVETNTRVTGTKATNTNVTNMRVTDTKVDTKVVNTNARQVGGDTKLRRLYGPMPELDIVEANDTIFQRVAATKTAKQQYVKYKREEATKLKATEMLKKEQKSDNSNNQIVGFYVNPTYITNVFNPAKGDPDTYTPTIVVYQVYSDGHEAAVPSSGGFIFMGTPYVDISRDDKTHKATVLDSDGITQQQWQFLNDENIPVFTYDEPLPPKPSLADVIADVDLPEVHEPDLQRDMDSDMFQIPLEEIKIDTDVKGDYIFLRTKKEIDINPIKVMAGRGYTYLRISINRIHKKSYDNLMDHIDELALTYSTRKAEKKDDNIMGDKKKAGYDASQTGKSEVTEDGELNMDAYLTNYLSSIESETVELDSMAVQRLKYNVDMKDFSTCLYSKLIIPENMYNNFDEDYDKTHFNDIRRRERVRTQLQAVEYNYQTNYDNEKIAFDNLWKHDPYLSMGYWSKWAMIGGYPPYNDSDFPGLQLELDASYYRQGNHSLYTDGGHLASSAQGKEIYNVSQFFAPGMFNASDRNDHRRYTWGFEKRQDAVDVINAMIFADCRMAAAIRNAAHDVSWITSTHQLEDVYKYIEKPYGTKNICLVDYYTFKRGLKEIQLCNKATFRVMNVPLMIYADYDGEYQGRTKTEYNKFINEGTILRNDNIYVISRRPNIVWRLNRKRAHQVTLENNMMVSYGNDFISETKDDRGKTQYSPKKIEAISLLRSIKNLKFACYRQNAYHTAIGADGAHAFDVCTEKQANGSYYFKPEIKEFNYNPTLETHQLGNYMFDIKDVMK